MTKELKPHVLYRLPLGEIKFDILSQECLIDILSNGRYAPAFIDPLIVRTFNNLYQVGDGAGSDIEEYFGALGQIQNKTFHSSKSAKRPDNFTIHTISSAQFEALKSTTCDAALDYIAKFDHFLYCDLDFIKSRRLDFVAVPSGLVRKEVELSFQRSLLPRCATQKGKVRLNFIRENIKRVEDLPPNEQRVAKKKENVG